MADYTVNIGGNTTMMIRDTGGMVEFWVKTGPQTWNNQQPWGYGANGGNSGTLYYRMLAGGNWQKFGEVYVGYNQTVRFTLVNSGLGFPSYDFFQAISRSTVPPAPWTYATYPVSSTEIHVDFASQGDGGSPIQEWQIGYGSNPNYPELYVGSGGNTTVGGFSSGQKVYFWTRGRNLIGWGPWSNRTEATTWRVPYPPSLFGFPVIAQTMVQVSYQDRGDGGQEILERQIGYGKNASAPTDFTNADISGFQNVSNLDPGKLYYFWVRNRNSIGWGPWSDRAQVLLIAGARIMVDGEWKRAVPYIKVDGQWKVGRPWVKNAGVWKESSV